MRSHVVMSKWGLALALFLATNEASALLVDFVGPMDVAATAEAGPGDGSTARKVEMTFHYPYPTTVTYVDPGYAFDDDPLTAFPSPPFEVPVRVRRVTVRRVMIAPRTSFVSEMFESTGGL
ncbi:MAG: hypothetical protein KC731_33285 [Myxococcales bacterium]|nr:hypothetical protein [Myxococcales bacterium]